MFPMISGNGPPICSEKRSNRNWRYLSNRLGCCNKHRSANITWFWKKGKTRLNFALLYMISWLSGRSTYSRRINGMKMWSTSAVHNRRKKPYYWTNWTTGNINTTASLQTPTTTETRWTVCIMYTSKSRLPPKYALPRWIFSNGNVIKATRLTKTPSRRSFIRSAKKVSRNIPNTTA